MSVLAVIPARGGSKGVWRKNLRRVAGEPLIAHAVRAATLTGVNVVVSSDDEEILRAANAVRPSCDLRRPDGLSGDEASSESAVAHALEVWRKLGHELPEIVLLVQCTSPLTIPEDIDGVIETLRASPDADCCFTVTRFHGFVWKDRSHVIGHESDWSYEALHRSHAGERKRRQDLSPTFRETGAVYAMRTEAFLRTGSRFCGKSVLYEVPAERALDIDSELDIEIADFLLRKRKERCGL